MTTEQKDILVALTYTMSIDYSQAIRAALDRIEELERLVVEVINELP